MDRSGENAVGAMSSMSSQGVPMEGVKFSTETGNTNRRALRDIKNLMGAPIYPCAVSKRGLSDKATVDCKNQGVILGHRPMTRKYAATLANKGKICHQEPTENNERQKRSATSAQISNASNAAYDEDHRSGDEFPLPMMEEMVSTELKEIEMEDLEEDTTVPDIDSFDSKNPLAVVDYVEDIYNFYRKDENSGCVSPNYMANQFDINEKMRAILIDWLIEARTINVHYKFELMDETLFLTVNIIDRFLARQNVVRKKLQLVGVTAMLLACKYEEVTVPVVEDLILISGPRIHAKRREFDCQHTAVQDVTQSDKKLELLSFFIVELCLVEYDMLKFRPSLLAAAAVYTAQCAIKGYKHWDRSCEMHTRYSEDQLLECSKIMVEFHKKAGQGRLTGVHRKYSTFKFGYTAKLDPALFLLGTNNI
uniref:Cyclin N-terminal domain-containing protein n=1 Tax=Ananas comosus var. bracteatus TaxID=296719 RepID=A0A6V7PIC6_ANACO|nr:unnamed protein product [Ananas comosus var. bracteatus]